MGNQGNPGQCTRRRFFGLAARAGAGWAAAPALEAFAAGSSPSPRPNIVFVLTDDQRWDTMGCAGNPLIQTPNMDALARGGVRFENAFVTTSICMAGRASVFTGLYERAHRYNIGAPPLDDSFIDMSYPALLRAAGYRTGFIGKFGVAVRPGAQRRMFDLYKPMGQPYFKEQPDGTQRHLTDIAADEAIAFLRGCNPDQPFCLSISFSAPHATDKDPRQYFWPKEYNQLYEDAVIPAPQTADPAFFEQQPEFLRNSLNRVRWHWRFDEPQKAQEMIKGYYRMISHVDAAIGRIRQELDRQGVSGNTVLILTSDNGYFLGEHGFADKWLPYEESIRVPLVVFDPRAEARARGIVPKQMALNVDIAPTLLDLAGHERRPEMQGRSLAPLLRGEQPDWRQDFLYEFLRKHSRIPQSEGVRSERWKYIRYFGQNPVREELYDLAEDPHEERNLANDERAGERLDTLRRRCDALGRLHSLPGVSALQEDQKASLPSRRRARR